MDDCFHVILCKSRSDTLHVADVPNYQLDTVTKGISATCREVVDNNDPFSGVGQFMDRMAANITGATCHEHSHVFHPVRFVAEQVLVMRRVRPAASYHP